MNVTNVTTMAVSGGMQVDSIRLLMGRLDRTPTVVRRGENKDIFSQPIFSLILDGRNLTIILPSSSPNQLEKLVVWIPFSWVGKGTSGAAGKRRITRRRRKIVSNQGN